MNTLKRTLSSRFFALALLTASFFALGSANLSAITIDVDGTDYEITEDRGKPSRESFFPLLTSNPFWKADGGSFAKKFARKYSTTGVLFAWGGDGSHITAKEWDGSAVVDRSVEYRENNNYAFATAQSVPDAGSTTTLLVSGLLGLVAFSRKIRGWR
ncbi:VPDSG-CTERM sorting domain-containing protein [Pelagicoccus mobilis]|uniref:VPDSG-CTERM sorting domain-containing protein n=1 Tax=Pelagicoccus mobilis TaxID=415221 RepID=A0A934VQ47_9BACT|nr:VPDSG-CTERM sorting domain-containing protein [Pelagicoccus mobilis]MBK1876515.1 VPDSG-CTERM sorting domain-containing protein [Pelagicoccus mobilis]